MPHFSTVPIREVVPKRKLRSASQRAQIQKQYQDAVRDAIIAKGEALVVELEPSDKALTIRNRIKRATDELGLDNVSIRRKKDRIVAYPVEPEAS